MTERLTHFNFQATRSYMPQLNISCAATKTWCSQINEHFPFLRKKYIYIYIYIYIYTPTPPSTQDKAWFPCSDSNGSPSWPAQHEWRSDSPVAPLEKAQVPCLSSTGGLTLLWQLERKVEFHAATWDEAWIPCWYSVGTRRSLSQLKRNPQFPTSTRDEALFPCRDSRGIPRCPRNSKGGLTSLSQQERFPEVYCNSRGTLSLKKYYI